MDSRTEINLKEIVIGQEFTIPLIGSDFRMAQYTNPYNCPLAKAFKRYFWLSHSVCVSPYTIKIAEENEPTYIFDIIGGFGSLKFRELKDIVENDKDKTLQDKVIYNVLIKFTEKI